MRREGALVRFQGTARPLLLSLLTYVLGVGQDSMHTWLQARYGAGQVALWAGICLLILLLAVVAPPRLLQWAQSVFERTGPEVERLIPDPPGHRGIIVGASVGPGISSLEQAVRYHWEKGRLERCWILTGGPKSEADAREAVARLVRDGVSGVSFEYRDLTAGASIDKIDDPEVVSECVESIYRGLPPDWSEKDVVADYTGITKSVTAGMVLACALPTRHLQFMKPRAYTPDGRADPNAGSYPVLVDINYSIRPARKR